MSFGKRTLRNSAIGVFAFLLVGLVVVIQVIQTESFRDYVRKKIITATEEATGGRVELGSFSFDWRHLRTQVTDFVIHGTEPSNAQPFIHVAKIDLDIHLFTSPRLWSISYLAVEKPYVNVMVFEDGTNNIPRPRNPSASDTTPLETVVNLAVGRFELNNGIVQYGFSSSEPLSVKGDNLKVELNYSVLKQSYQGQLSLQPVYFVEGRQRPVILTLTVPVALERDKISVQNASITTPLSDLRISGSLANLKQPKTSIRVNGHIAVADLNRLGNLTLAENPDVAASTIFIDSDAEVAEDTIKVGKLNVTLGRSGVEATGVLRDPASKGTLAFKSTINLDELSKLIKLKPAQKGDVSLDGTARYENNILDLQTFRLRAFGSELTGNASLENFAEYRVQANLRDMNISTIAQKLALQRMPYEGTVSGAVEVQGNLNSSIQKDFHANAKLSIAPGRRGIPVKGQIEGEYAAPNDVRIANSYLNLAHTQMKFSGSLVRGLHVDLTTQDLNDLLAAIPSATPPAVSLKGGQATLSAAVTGSFIDPHITGHLSATRLTIQDRQFDAIATDFNAAKSRISVDNGNVSRATMRAQFAGSAGLADWSLTQNQPLSVNANVTNGDLADILALAGQKSSGYSGALTATVNVAGTVGNPTGSANLQVAKGTLATEAFDQLQAQINLVDQRVTVPSAFVAFDTSRVTLTADYQHPRDSFTSGHLNAHLTSNPVDLSKLRNVQAARANTGGVVQVDATVAGDLKSSPSDQSEFLLTSVAGDLTAKGVRFDGQDYGDLTAKASTSGNTVTYNLGSNLAGSTISADGRTQLLPDYPTTLDASIGNLPLDRVLVLAKRTDIPVKGTAAGTLHVTGTVKDPQGTADLNVTNAVFYDEPVDRVRVQVAYLPDSIDVKQLDVTAGPSHLGLTAKFDHPRDNLKQGEVQFQIQNGHVDLARVRSAQLRRPGLAGTLQISGQGKGTIQDVASNPVKIEDLTAHIGSTGLSLEGRSLGNLDLAASTLGGKLNFTLESGLASAAIHGRGSAVLSGDYPVNAEVTLSDLKWSNLQPLVTGGPPSAFEGVTGGQITVDGPLTNLDQLSASVRLTTLQLRPSKFTTQSGPPMVLQNQGDIAVKLEKGVVRIESAHLTGPQTDITATGTATIRDKSLNLRVNANANLALLRTMDADIYSGGKVTLVANIQGTADSPSINGRAELQGASVNYAGLPAGISNANGLVVFNGNTATIQNLTAESGGGRLTLTGFATREPDFRFAIRANANGVRVRIQPGVSVVATANVSLGGTADNSNVSGTVNIDRLTYLPQTDIGSILTRSGPPVETSADSSPLLQNMTLDIAVRTSSATSFQASLADNLQVNADLRIRGRASQPGMVGTIQMNHGTLAFFGSTYKISSGTISFYNPNRIEPILDISLETQAKGVTVVLSVRGPVDDLKLSYTSDPPLQFEEIIALLAAGKAPTSDPTLLANQPSVPDQSLEQRGESALVGKALADPLSNRLQRVFGVSQLKIDPSFTSGSQIPQARVTLQQQVATNLVFTYVTALDDPNTQIVRIEWSMTPRWSAIGNRDENGLVSVTLQYTRQIR